jgi:hypothetical protein
MPEYRIFHATDTDWWRGNGHQGPPILINVDVSRLRSGRLRAESQQLRRAQLLTPNRWSRRRKAQGSHDDAMVISPDLANWPITMEAHPSKRGFVGGHGPSDDPGCKQQGTGSGRPLTTPGRPPSRFPLSQQNNPRRWTRAGDAAVDWLASMFSPVPQGVH